MTKTNPFNLGLIEPIGSEKKGEEPKDKRMLACSKHSTHGCRVLINYDLISHFHSCILPSAKCEIRKCIIRD